VQDVHLGKVRGHLKAVSGKGDKDRTLPLNADVVAALRGYLDVRPKTADHHLFLGRTGKALTHDGLQYLVKKYGALAGIEGLHPHVLRHCFARRLLERGVDIASVSRLLGHEDLRTTMRYVEPSAGDLEDAVAKLEEEW
jgi:site-specific recombinase XerD